MSVDKKIAEYLIQLVRSWWISLYKQSLQGPRSGKNEKKELQRADSATFDCSVSSHQGINIYPPCNSVVFYIVFDIIFKQRKRQNNLNFLIFSINSLPSWIFFVESIAFIHNIIQKYQCLWDFEKQEFTGKVLLIKKKIITRGNNLTLSYLSHVLFINTM